MKPHSTARQLANYANLVVFAKDKGIREAELHLLERLALEDHIVDAEEREVLRGIFARLDRHLVEDHVQREIDTFREQYGV